MTRSFRPATPRFHEGEQVKHLNVTPVTQLVTHYVHSLAFNGPHCFRGNYSKSNLSNGLEEPLSLVPKLQFRLVPAATGQLSGAHLDHAVRRREGFFQ